MALLGLRLPNVKLRQIAEREYTLEVLNLTEQLLRKNPEYYTIWNHRRLVLQHQLAHTSSIPSETTTETQSDPILDVLNSELRFLVPLLLKFPKCYWIWNYRLWLLSQSDSLLPPALSQRLWKEELGLVTKMLHRDQRNFHGWGYRRRVVLELENSTGRSMVEQEFEYTTKMVEVDLGNFSAWHHRSKLIPRLLDERTAGSAQRRKFLDDEFALVLDAMVDPNNQSVWFYHQYLMSTLAPSLSREAAVVLDLNNGDRVRIYEREMENIREMLEDFEDCKWIYQSLLQYAKEYLDVEAGNKALTTMEMRGWLAKLKELDPLRMERWDDLENNLHL